MLYVTLTFFYARLVMSRELRLGPRAPVHLSLYVGDWRSGVLIHQSNFKFLQVL